MSRRVFRDEAVGPLKKQTNQHHQHVQKGAIDKERHHGRGRKWYISVKICDDRVSKYSKKYSSKVKYFEV